MAENQVYLIKSGQNSFVEETEAIIGISGGRLGVGTTTPEADLHVTGSVKIGGDLAVDGTFTTINSNTISVDDKNIELGSTDNPTDVTADGGGITVKGTTDKTFNWSGNNSAWTSSEHLYLANGKHFSADELRALDSDGLKLADQTTSGVLIKGGKVGIHKTTPVYDLDVDGSGNFASLYVDGNAVLTGEGSIFGKWEDGATEGEIYYTGGNVGVGTNNPEHKIHVVGDSVVDGNFIVNGTSGNLNVSNFNVSGDSIVLNYLGDTLASDRGGLTVRTNTEDKSFEYVGGSSNFWLSSENIQINPGKELQTDKVRAIDGDGLYLHDDAGNGIFVKDGGDVGIKNITPSVALDVSGSAKISANVNVSQDINVGNSLNVGSDVFEINKDGVVGNAPPQNGYVITWSSEGKWKALPGGGGGSSSSEVPLAFSTILETGSVHQITFDGGPYDNVPSIATDLEILGDGPLIPYYISGLSNAGYSAVFAQDITVENSYKLHTTFGGRDVLWATGVDAGSIYYNDGEVSIGNNLTVGGSLTVNGTTTTVNTETVEIKDHNLVIASNTGYNQLTSEYPGAGGAYAGILWGTGDAGSASPVRLTYQTNKGFAFEGGNVGIGTTNPQQPLQVSKKSSSTSISHPQEDSAIKITNYSTSADGQFVSLNFSIAGTAGATADSVIAGFHEGSGHSSLRFYTEGSNILSEKMRITNGGNVGIGTTNPLDILHVSPQGMVNSNFRISGGHGLIHLKAVNDANNANVDLGLGPVGNTIYIKKDGNVGIGTTNPGTNKLDVQGAVSVGASATSTSAGYIKVQGYRNATDQGVLGHIRFDNQNEGNTAGKIEVYAGGSTTTGTMRFHTSGSEKMRITANGNVGIGTTNPGAALHVERSTGLAALRLQSGDADQKIQFNDGAGILFSMGVDVSEQNLFVFSTSSISNALSIKQNGNVGIGTTNPREMLDIDGQIVGGFAAFSSHPANTTLSGTISITAGTNTVTGTGTLFRQELSTRNTIIIDGVEYETSAISSDTSMTLTSNHIAGVVDASFSVVQNDWNYIAQARPGMGKYILLDSAKNGPLEGVGSDYFYSLGFQYLSTNAQGNLTQIAIPYRGNEKYMRYRYNGNWSAWTQII